ncbi:hypothetical protein [Streptomyces griseus]|nr:hypothetical protein [Streptomyces griseus]
MGERVEPEEIDVKRGWAGPVPLAGTRRSATATAEGTDSAPALSTAVMT